MAPRCPHFNLNRDLISANVFAHRGNYGSNRKCRQIRS